MTSQNNPQAIQTYRYVLSSFLRGLERLSVVQVAFSSTVIATLEAHGAEFAEAADATSNTDTPYARVTSPLRTITEEELQEFEYFHATSELVLATSLLDTFLSETTRFLFLLHPASIGKNSSITLDSLLRSTSKTQLIAEAAERRTRELAFLGFEARLEFLRDTFGMSVEIPQEAANALRIYSGVRNVLIHDQGFYEVLLTENGVVVSERTPHDVKHDDVNRAILAYRAVAYEVSLAVFTQVLRAGSSADVREILDMIRSSADDMLQRLRKADASL